MTIRRASTRMPRVCAALNGCDDDIVLVGHSYGGHTIAPVAARRRVRHLVYLCAYIPNIGRSAMINWVTCRPC
ncbi:MAG TPA: alpha/beta fold hydrolase [Mycobacterium sp.]|nr:alpha/beta fold hydrolase [Mycobacterium sp.]